MVSDILRSRFPLIPGASLLLDASVDILTGAPKGKSAKGNLPSLQAVQSSLGWAMPGRCVPQDAHH